VRPEIVATTSAIARLGFTLPPHPARISLPAISASSRTEGNLRGQKFSSDEEVKVAVPQIFWEKETGRN